MIYRGHVEKGVIVLDEPASLQEGTEVLIEPFTAPAIPKDETNDQSVLIGRDLLEFSGIMEGYPTDMARNHDHYLHGRPKK